MIHETKTGLACGCESCPAIQPSTSGQRGPFESMLRTLGWTVRLVAKIGVSSHWGWFCPACSKAGKS